MLDAHAPVTAEVSIALGSGAVAAVAIDDITLVEGKLNGIVDTDVLAILA